MRGDRLGIISVLTTAAALAFQAIDELLPAGAALTAEAAARLTATTAQAKCDEQKQHEGGAHSCAGE